VNISQPNLSEKFDDYDDNDDDDDNNNKSSTVAGLEWPRGFQEVKVPRFHDNGTGWW